jgi:hypothetical protein
VIWTYRLKPYHVEAARVCKVGLVPAALLIAYFVVPVQSIPAQIAWALFLALCFPALLLLLRLPTPGEWELLRSGPSRIRAMRLGSRIKSAGR